MTTDGGRDRVKFRDAIASKKNCKSTESIEYGDTK